MDKLALLEQRKRQWKCEHELNVVREECLKENAPQQHHKQQQQQQQNQNQQVEQQQQTQRLLHLLTDKLTTHIRKEVRKEMESSLVTKDVVDSVTNKMESFLQTELRTNLCPICYELMTSPNHTPILLFPCGHSLCQQCNTSIQACASGKSGKGRDPQCPCCRSKIASSAVNQPLRELIDQFAKQRARVEQFPLSAGSFDCDTTASTSSRHHSHNRKRDHVIDMKANNASEQFEAQQRACETRLSILSGELEELRTELDTTSRRRVALQSASQHLQQERKLVCEKLQQLEEERELIDKHLREQAQRQIDLTTQEEHLTRGIELIASTVNDIAKERDKLGILKRGVEELSVSRGRGHGHSNGPQPAGSL